MFAISLAFAPSAQSASGDWDRAWGKNVVTGGGTGFEICTVAADCKFGEDGGLGGEFFGRAGAVAVDGSGNVYVVDGARIQKFDPAGNFLLAWGHDVIAPSAPGDLGAVAEICTVAANCSAGDNGTLGGEFTGPAGIAVDGAGNVYVSEATVVPVNNRIQKFTSNGVFVRAWGRNVIQSGKPNDLGAGAEVCTVAADCQLGTVGTLGGELGGPTHLGADAAGNVYASEFSNDRIQKFTAAGAFDRVIGKDVVTGGVTGAEVCTVASQCKAGTAGNLAGELGEPAGLATDGAGNLYVAESDNNRIQKFTPLGASLLTFGGGGTRGGSFADPDSIAIDSQRIYVGDFTNRRVQRFTLSGAWDRAWGKDVVIAGRPGDTGTGFEICFADINCKAGASGALGGEMVAPTGMGVNAQGDLYVADSDRRVQKFDAPEILTVNSNLDGDDGSCTAAALGCTLREAINAANAAPGQQTIEFAIPGAPLIEVASQLPAITGTATVDAETQVPGTPEGTPDVELAPASGSSATDGLVVQGIGTIVRGLVVRGFAVNGIVLQGNGAHRLEGNFIGTDKTGQSAAGNLGAGVLVNGTANTDNLVGGGLLDRNVISANGTGVVLGGQASQTIVQGNLIGTDADGVDDLGNELYGVDLAAACTIPSGTLVCNSVLDNTISGQGSSCPANDCHGIRVRAGPASSSHHTLIGRNRIGTNAAGTAAMANKGNGILVEVSFTRIGVIPGGDSVGGFQPQSGNLISGNALSGVLVTAGSQTSFANNQIGTNTAGSAAVPNGGAGIELSGGSTTLIGNLVSGGLFGNLISGNTGAGVLASGGSGIFVQRNQIGTNAAGTAAIPNGGPGVDFQAGAGGTGSVGNNTPQRRNIISGNPVGILIAGGGRQVRGNFIGLDINGSPLGNSGPGIRVLAGGSATIGSPTDAGMRNVISGNGGPGIELEGNGSTVAGNRIGTNTAGTGAIPNAVGIRVSGDSNGIGGVSGDPTNLISGNTGAGVQLTSGASSNGIQGNLIGTAANGSDAVGNGLAGVAISSVTVDPSSSNQVGGTAAGTGNRIAFNGQDGVNVCGLASENAVRGNSINSNGGLGIDLEGTDGVTANDSNDPDTGPNQLQNFPLLSSAESGNQQTVVQGSLDTDEASASYRIEYFSSPSCDGSGNGEGRFFVGAANVTTDGSGDATINATLPAAATPGTQLTATATDAAASPTGNTSEFSPCQLVTVAAGQQALSIAKAGTGTGTVTATGINCGEDCAETYANGTMVTLTASPDFSATVGWSGCDSTGVNTCTVAMNSSRSVTATFTATTSVRRLTVVKSGNGTVTSSPAGISCGADCLEDYPFGSTVTLTAAPGGGDTFTSWSGCDNPQGSQCVQNLTGGNESVTANFTGATQTEIGINDQTVNEGNAGSTTFIFTVTLSAPAPVGGATVAFETEDETAIQPGDYASNSGTVTFNQGDTQETITVQVVGDTATETNETFTVDLTNPVGATCGDCTGQGTILNDDAAPVQRTLTVQKGGTGTGTVSGTGIDCGADCTETYANGTMVTLTAAPTGGSTFAGWTGCDSPSGTQCTMTMSANKTVTATFDPPPGAQRTLTVTTAGTGAGTVTGNGINCPGDCSQTYASGTVVSLTATPAGGSTFAWGGGCSGSGACGVTMDLDRSVSATFTAPVVQPPAPKCAGKSATRFGTNGNDVITGTGGADVIAGLGGKDTINGLGGNDLICAGGGNDTVRAGGGADKAQGDAGNDKLTGGGGNDTLKGQGGKDKLSGDAGKDKLDGGGSKDILIGGAGVDRLVGGPGADTERQ